MAPCLPICWWRNVRTSVSSTLILSLIGRGGGQFATSAFSDPAYATI